MAVPASGARNATRVMVMLLDIRLFVRMTALLSEAEDGKNTIEQGASTAEETDEDQQNDGGEDTNDDAGNGTARETRRGASCDGDILAGGDGGLEGNGGRWPDGRCHRC